MYMCSTSTCTTFGYENEGYCVRKQFGLSIIILLDENATQKIKRKKTTLGLDFYFRSLQFTPDKYVRRIWQLRRTIGKYVINVRRVRRISYTLFVSGSCVFGFVTGPLVVVII